MGIEDRAAAPARPCALLLEDDTAIARLVALVAADCGVDLRVVGSLAAAHQALLSGRHALMLTDLWLPDGCAVDWLGRLRQSSPPLGADRVVVFSAGLTPSVRRTLEGIGVHEFLCKPASVDALSACFVSLHRADRIRSGGGDEDAAGDAIDVVARYFGGDVRMHADFLAAFRERLRTEARRGRACLQARDLPALARLSHGLKSALQMLGQGRLAQCAAAVEAYCAEGDAVSSVREWQHLCLGLRAWAADMPRPIACPSVTGARPSLVRHPPGPGSALGP